MKLTRAEIGALIVTLVFAALASGYMLAGRGAGADFTIETKMQPSAGDILTGGDILPESTKTPSEDSSGTLAVNINAASAEELTSLPGIGEVLAERVVEYREQNGAFARIEDIMDVHGIGEAIFNGISPMITVA